MHSWIGRYSYCQKTLDHSIQKNQFYSLSHCIGQGVWNSTEVYEVKYNKLNGLVSMVMCSEMADEANLDPEESLTCRAYLRMCSVGRWRHSGLATCAFVLLPWTQCPGTPGEVLHQDGRWRARVIQLPVSMPRSLRMDLGSFAVAFMSLMWFRPLPWHVLNMRLQKIMIPIQIKKNQKTNNGHVCADKKIILCFPYKSL